MSRARERSTLYGGTSGVAAIFGFTKIGVATATLGTKTLALIGVAATNPITAAIAGAVVVGTVVYGLTKLEELEERK